MSLTVTKWLTAKMGFRSMMPELHQNKVHSSHLPSVGVTSNRLCDALGGQRHGFHNVTERRNGHYGDSAA